MKKILFSETKKAGICKWIQTEDWAFKKKRSKKGSISYLNEPIGFDIEDTSTYTKNGDPIAFMYVWHIVIKDHIFWGRTWEQFVSLMELFTEELDLNPTKRMMIYVHNLGHEFAFMYPYFKWNDEDFMANNSRSPIRSHSNGIEFRCSYALSGYSLDKLGKKYTGKYGIEKLTGTYDYNKIRTFLTELTDLELKYCDNDVLVIQKYIEELIKNHKNNITQLPYTKTGFVRIPSRKATLYCYDKEGKQHYSKEYKLIKGLKLTVEEYLICKWAFRGGDTHANAMYIGNIVKNVASFDETSAYPAAMICMLYPMSNPIHKTFTTWEDFRKLLKRYLLIFTVKFTNIKQRPGIYHNYLSYSKAKVTGDYTTDNGRIYQADTCEVAVTNMDMHIISKCYTWDKMEIGKIMAFEPGYLPNGFRKYILEMYQKKTTLKGVEGMEYEYNRNKEDINSTYGMICQDPCKDVHVFKDGKWGVKHIDYDKAIKEYNESSKKFTYYPWAVFVTAYARYNLFQYIFEAGEDHVYSDTDSGKLKNYEKHKEFFENYNKNMDRLMIKAMRSLDLPDDYYKPKTIDGVEKPLGYWDFEGVYDEFKTLGAKRYVYSENGKITMKCAGVKGENVVKYFEDQGKNVFDEFDDDMYIPAEHTGKLTHTYCDEPMFERITDYQGKTADVYTKSFVHLSKQHFSLSLADEFLDFLEGYRLKGV